MIHCESLSQYAAEPWRCLRHCCPYQWPSRTAIKDSGTQTKIFSAQQGAIRQSKNVFARPGGDLRYCSSLTQSRFWRVPNSDSDWYVCPGREASQAPGLWANCLFNDLWPARVSQPHFTRQDLWLRWNNPFRAFLQREIANTPLGTGHGVSISVVSCPSCETEGFSLLWRGFVCQLQIFIIGR